MHVRLKLMGPALLGSAALLGTLPTIGEAAEPFTLRSPAYQDGDAWPSKFAGSDPSRTNPPCPGQNVSPPLAWSNAPAATKSFAILMYDPDGRNGLGSAHWVAYDIPPTKTSLAEGEASVAPTGFVGGRNNVGTGHYFGPCSSTAGSPHHYVITVIATDVEPGRLKPGLARDELLGELRGHALAAASIIGRYTRPSP
jgi:Raf kinase inhibitor-like YbhB/YbcL family protein